MRIAFVTTHYPPSTGFGGVTEASYQLSQALAEFASVSVITSDAALDGRVPLDAFIEKEKANLKIYPYQYQLNRKSAPSFVAHRMIRTIIKECDIVHINGIYTYPVTIAAWAAQRYKKPHIVALRNGFDPFMWRIRRSKKILGLCAYVQPILQKADLIHATAEQEVEHAKALGIRNEFVVVPNGIDTVVPHKRSVSRSADDEWPMLKGKEVVLFLSRLSPQKGLDMLIPAWSAVHHKNNNAILVIAGPDYQGHESFVRGLVDRFDVKDSVLFTGNVEHERKWMLYEKAMLFVLPSYSENFGNVIAEALSFNLPVLTTTATPWASINTYNCGFCVEPKLENIRNALALLLSKSPLELKTMGQRAPELLAGMNTWRQSAEQFMDIYKRLIKH